jgi:hypothetical protein
LGATASGSEAMALGRGVIASGNNSTSMGTRASTNGHSGAFVYGDASPTLAVSATVANQFVVRAQHFWLGTDNSVSNPAGHFLTTSTGAFLSTGGAWTNASDVARKDRFESVDGEWVLEQLAALPIKSWGYRQEATSIRHLGPTAQDFRAAFGLGNGDKAITTVDADGVSLVAAQTLERRTRGLMEENAQLRVRLAELERRLERLESSR